MERFDFEIRSSWEGGALRRDEYAAISLSIDARLELTIEAAFYDDPPPPGPRGRCDGLWEFEVVELFLLGRDDRYLELEFGPHGHWLAYGLAGRRQLVEPALEIERFQVARAGSRWRGEATIPLAHLPPGLWAGNAYAIHGVGPARRFLAAHPIPGERPDFHQIAAFPPLEGGRRRDAVASAARSDDGIKGRSS